MRRATFRKYPRSLALAQAMTLALAGSAAAVHANPLATSTQVVQNCDDSGPGSLREIYGMATSGIVDLGQLACSTITLTSGPVSSAVYAGHVTLQGSPLHRVTISGNGSSSVVVHHGSAVSIEDLTIEAGVSNNFLGGGCIYSEGEVRLSNSTVHGCQVSTTGATPALGGAIRAKSGVVVFHSDVRDNHAFAASAGAAGGAIHAPYVRTGGQTSISGNSAGSGDGHPARGGGVFAGGGLVVGETTFSKNSAGTGGAIEIGDITSFGLPEILNSTISGNDASGAGGGVLSAVGLVSYNSTVALNRSGFEFGAGVYVSQGNAILSSTIIAGNTSNDGLSAADLAGHAGITVFGEHNLIVASTVPVPVDTIDADPKLAPLADNGGGVLTHALFKGSPAIDAGENLGNFYTDQRGYVCAVLCFPAERTFGPAPDIGAIEFGSPDGIFESAFEDD